MVNDLVCNTAVVLQDVEVLGAADLGDLLGHGLFKNIRQLSIHKTTASYQKQ